MAVGTELSSRRSPGGSRIPPGPKGFVSILRNGRSLQQNAPDLFNDMRREYGDIARLPLGLFTAYLSFHPDLVQHDRRQRRDEVGTLRQR